MLPQTSDDVILLLHQSHFLVFMSLLVLLQDESCLGNNIMFILAMSSSELLSMPCRQFEQLSLGFLCLTIEPSVHCLVSDQHGYAGMVVTGCIPSFVDREIKVAKACLPSRFVIWEWASFCRIAGSVTAW